jgi:hypothetical protein
MLVIGRRILNFRRLEPDRYRAVTGRQLSHSLSHIRQVAGIQTGHQTGRGIATLSTDQVPRDQAAPIRIFTGHGIQRGRYTVPVIERSSPGLATLGLIEPERSRRDRIPATGYGWLERR